MTTNEFQTLLNSWCCTNCNFFINNSCTHDNFNEFNNQKEQLRLTYLNLYDTSSNKDGSIAKDWKKRSENIDNYFLCVKFKN